MSETCYFEISVFVSTHEKYKLTQSNRRWAGKMRTNIPAAAVVPAKCHCNVLIYNGGDVETSIKRKSVTFFFSFIPLTMTALNCSAALRG
jgi:hypothetical protein